MALQLVARRRLLRGILQGHSRRREISESSRVYRIDGRRVRAAIQRARRGRAGRRSASQSDGSVSSEAAAMGSGTALTGPAEAGAPLAAKNWAPCVPMLASMNWT